MSFQPLWEISALQAAPALAPAGEVLSFPESVEDPETAPLGLVPDLEAETEVEPDSEALLERLEAARQEGHAAGVQEAQAEMAPDLEALRAQVKELEELAAGLESAKAGQAKESAEQAVAIALALSRRVLGDSLIHAPHALEELVLRTLSRFPSGGRVRVHVPAARAEAIQALLAKQEVEVVAEAEMSGGCRVEREGCEVDASIEVLLSELDAGLAAP